VAIAIAIFFACFSLWRAIVRILISECPAVVFKQKAGIRHGFTHRTEVESMSRPNQGHPTFSVLFNADDVPRRARVPLHNGNNFSVATITVLDKLIFLLTPAAQTQCHPVLVLALQAQSTAFALESANFGLDVALATIFAILDYECSSV
jgi:hypothetical protein